MYYVLIVEKKTFQPNISILSQSGVMLLDLDSMGVLYHLWTKTYVGPIHKGKQHTYFKYCFVIELKQSIHNEGTLYFL